MSDSDSSSSREKSRSRSRRKSNVSPARSPARRSKSKSRSESRSRSRSRGRYSRSRDVEEFRSRQVNRCSRSHKRYRSRSRSRSRSYDRKRSDKHSSGSREAVVAIGSSSPFSNRRRHLGDRENPRQSRCLGVFGLSLYTTERELRDMFERFGPIENLQMYMITRLVDPEDLDLSYMKNAEDAAEAKDQLPGTELDGHKSELITQSQPGLTHLRQEFTLGRPTTSGSYRRSNHSPQRGSRRSDNGRRRSPSYSRSYSRSPRR